jgi:hypothetical protein
MKEEIGNNKISVLEDFYITNFEIANYHFNEIGVRLQVLLESIKE